MGDTINTLGVASRCHHNVGMADWQRLGRIIVDRRIELGYRRREDLGATLGVSIRTLGDIETGRRDRYHANTIGSLENALQWAPGSINAILAGGEPAPRPAHHTRASAEEIGLTDEVSATVESDDDPVVRIMADPRLTQQQKAQVIRQLIAEQQAFARQRADELLRAYRNGDQD
jgi:transcriptional regulator with XRE-family HTH domain